MWGSFRAGVLHRFILPAGPWAGAAGGAKLLKALDGSDGQLRVLAIPAFEARDAVTPLEP
eukprot:15466299-Alexandrium_andersonii.AAC.1